MVLGILIAWQVLRSVPGSPWFTLLYAIGLGSIDLGSIDRIIREHLLPGTGSDVLDATSEAVAAVFAGQNPYTHAYLTTRPAFSPFPYLPGEMLFYGVPLHVFHISAAMTEKCAGIGILFIMAMSAPIVGIARAALCTALYATAATSSWVDLCGSNDIGLSFVSLTAILMLAGSEALQERSIAQRYATGLFYLSAGFLAWALLFKAIFWPFYPFILLYLWRKNASLARRHCITTISLCAAAIFPFLFPFPTGIIGLISNIHSGFVYHNNAFLGVNIWYMLQEAGFSVRPGSFVTIANNVVVLGVFLISLMRRYASLSEALMYGSGVSATALLLSQYTPYRYWMVTLIMVIAALGLHKRNIKPAQNEAEPAKAPG